jgi:foldase protein PrsA
MGFKTRSLRWPAIMRRTLTLLALGAFFVPASIIAGCGGVPGNAVAEVDGTAIEKDSFEHWMNIAAKSQGADNAVPVPPDYKDCIAQLKKNAAKPKEGQPKQSDADYKKQCEEQYKQMREQVLGLLFAFEWFDREAEERGVKVSDAEVKKSFEQQKKQSFPKEADYQKFLKESGYTEEDLFQQVRFDLVRKKLVEQVTKGKDKVSDQQVEDYYNENKTQFAQPERRDVSVILTKPKDKEKAQQAKAELEGGASWKSVAKKYSIDDASKAQGGKLPAVAKGQQEKAFDDAIFKAKKGVISGPVKTQFGWYVFRVDKITKASQQSLKEASPTIKQVLAAQSQDKATEDFFKSLQREWREKTECRDEFATPNCKNGPDPTPTPTPATGQPAPAPEE